MTCQYCRATNDTDAHRCTRCGRRTLDRTPVQMTAAVPQLETVEMPAPTPLRPQLVTQSPAPRPAPPAQKPAQPAYQANLFGPMLAASKPAESRAALPRKSAPRVRRDHSRQGTLDFPETRTLKNQVEAAVYCGAPVAIPTHRAMAAIIDGALAVIALGLFGATLRVAGVEILVSKQTLPYYAGAAILILLFYRVLFCIANTDTPGLRSTGLQILDFDGRTPTRRQRWYRLIGGCVGAISAGIGLIWAIFDQERLTWHDHMSKTFPTPRFF